MGYLGSKAASGAYQAIIALMPPHDTYVDLFAGSGAVLLRKPPAARSYAVDLDRAALDRVPDDFPGLVKHHGCAFRFIDDFNYARSGRTLIYADPPYLHATRTSSKRYRHELTDDDHRALLQRLMLSSASVIVSGYPSDLYDFMLSGWPSVSFQVMTRGGPRTERLWFNFPPGSTVQWASYAGRDFTHRQQIKRKAARWAAKYRELPPCERLAVLASLLEADAVPGDRA
ncbi:hypothetical protein HN018_28165 (plasmid) [Lichenicola cladoniae]|uniref:Uncharacterized protein n=2 Tax=Lichenicola cladoniae TaxID=1484109 RepID=A0A6M8HZL3_9PROT|nr:hypothetical protein [Acetobacteraceae bacterium]QKE94014.1 hypothetical protein HN018_28165 [Lichenicola cladoniae]